MDKRSDGFTLVELVIVIAILGIIYSIAVPKLTGFKSMAEEQVCAANRKTVERMYTASLLGNDHSESMFIQFINETFDEICPSCGIIRYEDGEIKCNSHRDEVEEDDSPGEEVPWL